MPLPTWISIDIGNHFGFQDGSKMTLQKNTQYNASLRGCGPTMEDTLRPNALVEEILIMGPSSGWFTKMVPPPRPPQSANLRFYIVF